MNEQASEETKINELYSQLLVATDDSSKITISVEDLKTLITEQVKEVIKEEKENYVPAGTVISYMGNTAPTGYLFCDGKTYNISDYPNLAEQIKSQFGSYNYYGGDGTTTFAVPNLQGEFLRGYSTSSSASVTNGVSTTNVGKHQDGTLHSMIGVHDNGGAELWVGGYGHGLGSSIDRKQDASYGTSTAFIHSNSTYRNTDSIFVGKPTCYTSRPTNTSVLYCIKY